MDLHLDDAQRVVTDAVAVTPAFTMPLWLTDLHGPAGEVAFWCAVFVAVARAAWVVWDFADRIRRGRANRSPVNGFSGTNERG